jgi:hypothetical protein
MLPKLAIRTCLRCHLFSTQDRALVVFALGGDKSVSLFAVMDGHGEFGHVVAQWVKDNLPEYLIKQSNLTKDTPKAIISAVKQLTDALATKHVRFLLCVVFSSRHRDCLFLLGLCWTGFLLATAELTQRLGIDSRSNSIPRSEESTVVAICVAWGKPSDVHELRP